MSYEERYGKEKSEKIKNKKSENIKISIKNNPEHLDRLRKLCLKNSNFYDVWLEKFGKQEADFRYKKWLLHKNKTSTGSENIAKKENVKEKISLSIKKKWNDVKYRKIHTDRMYDNTINEGRITSENTKTKQRLSAIKQIQEKIRSDFSPNYNKNSCDYFNKLMKEKNINIQHAENGGEFFIDELGYWVDGYDKINNVVYEYDEKRHYKLGELKQKDLIRENQIKNFLKCTIIRIKEK